MTTNIHFQPISLNKSSLQNESIVNGNVYFVKDTKELFYDFDSERIEIKDILILNTETERTSIAPLNKFYFVKETNTLWYYSTAWIQVSTKIDISVGTVTTLQPGSQATVENVGTESNAIFNFGIPQGIQGDKGDTGAKGDKGDKGDKGSDGEKGDTGLDALYCQRVFNGRYTVGTELASLNSSEDLSRTPLVGEKFYTLCAGQYLTLFEITAVSGETCSIKSIAESNLKGATGETGPKGDAGQGIASGGTTGQVLKKKSGTDYDTEWGDDEKAQWGNITGTLSAQTDLQASLNAKANRSDLADVATSGSYNDLSNLPSIPTVTDTYSSTSSSAMSGKAVASAISTKADSSNVYSKTEVDAKVSSVYRFMGSVASYSALPTDATKGDTYNLTDTGANYAWTGTEWDKLSETIDLTPYLTKTEASSTYANKADLKTVATTGSYTDLINKPSIPTVTDTYSATSTNAMSGKAVASAISGKQDTITGAISTGVTNNFTANVVVTTDASGKLGTSNGIGVSTTELSYLDGVTSNIQSQLNSKQSIYYEYTVDLNDVTTYPENTWFPVVFNPTSQRYYTRLQVINSVMGGNGTYPTWSNRSDKTFTAQLDMLICGNSYGANYTDSICLKQDFRWIVDVSNPPVGYSQLTYSSRPVLWLRGGGKYYLRSDISRTFEIVTASKTFTDQTVAPTTTYPKISFNKAKITANLVNSDIGSATATTATKSTNTTQVATTAFVHTVSNDRMLKTIGSTAIPTVQADKTKYTEGELYDDRLRNGWMSGVKMMSGDVNHFYNASRRGYTITSNYSAISPASLVDGSYSGYRQIPDLSVTKETPLVISIYKTDYGSIDATDVLYLCMYGHRGWTLVDGGANSVSNPHVSSYKIEIYNISTKAWEVVAENTNATYPNAFNKAIPIFTLWNGGTTPNYTYIAGIRLTISGGTGALSLSEIELREGRGTSTFLASINGLPTSGGTIYGDLNISQNFFLQGNNSTANTIPYINSNKALVSSAITPTELGYLDGTTSNIQTQLNTKATDSSVVHLANAETITGKKTFTTQQFLKAGAVFGGSAQEAGLVTRGICGVSTPNADGTYTKEHLYLNYDGNNDYTRKVYLGGLADGNIAVNKTMLNDSISSKANLASPALTGSPTAPTASKGTNTTQLATTAFVQTAIGDKQASITDTTTVVKNGTGLNAVATLEKNTGNAVFDWVGTQAQWTTGRNNGTILDSYICFVTDD